MSFSNISRMFYDTAEKCAKKRFISYEEKRFTYDEAARIVNRTARAMKSAGVEKGSRVVILLNNSPEFIFSVLAVFSCGAVAIPMNVFFKSREASYIINDSETEFVVSSEAFSEVIAGVREQCPKVRQIFSFDDALPHSRNLYSLGTGMDDAPLNTDTDADDLALFIYTSGTTGHPKGAMLTHDNIIKNLEGFAPVLGADEKDRFLVMLPMFHTYTFTACLMLPIYLGASMIILSSVMEMKKKSFRKLLIFQRPTFLLGVPQVFSALAKSPMPSWFVKLLYPVRIHVSGGASLPMEIFEQFEKKFGKPVIEGYGLSEASPVASFNTPEKTKPGTVGKPLPNLEAKVVDQEEMEVPRGTVGELIIKGPNVMRGYWKMPKATDDAIRNGWLFTGDMAFMDDEGYITIVDRKKDLIISKGMNVYPREVEEVIYKFPGIDAAAVIGVPSNESGEAIAAYIQPKEGAAINEKALRAYLKNELANFKLPKTIRVIENIPLTATGKVLKRQLKEMVKNGQL